MPKRFRCPHCGSIEMAEPDTERAVSVACEKCQHRFRVPKASGPPRIRTSSHQRLVAAQVQKQADQFRSQSDKDKLDRILRERRFGDYDILDELGRGGMGVVYKAFHRNLKRMVALKIVLPDAADQDTMLKRFRREAELHARLSHPNIVHVYDSGQIDGIHFFAMDFITGTQLSKLIGSPEFTLRQRLDIGRQVADALDHAHSHGVVHRDIKPDNVIVDAGWNAHLVDFGIAKPTDMSGRENITRQGLAIGTPHYMAPEQFRPAIGEIGPRSDVYSLGAVLYHTLSGHPPFESDTAHAVLIKAATQEAPPIAGTPCPTEEPIPEDAAAILARCMKKKPEERYPSGRALADDLQRFLDGEEVEANPLTDKERLRRRLRKNRQAVGLFAMIAAVFVVIMAAFVVTILTMRSRTEAVSVKVDQASQALTRAEKNTDDEDAISALEEAEGALVSAREEVNEGGRSVLFTALIAAGSAALIVFGVGYVTVLRPGRKAKAAAATPVAAQPEELGATADEVG